MNNLQYLINVPLKDVKQCFRFAEELYAKDAASPKQFGRRKIIRKKNDFIADHVIGKVVEIGFKRFLEINYNISFKVDFEIWEDQLVHDEGNDLATVIINGENKKFEFKTDIKGSRQSSMWLLVEQHKIINFGTQIYVIGILEGMPKGKDFENNPYNYINNSWNVRIKGYAYNTDLVDEKTRRGWIEYKKGDRLYNPSILKKCKWNYRNLTHSDYLILLAKTVNEAPPYQNKHIGGPLDCEINIGLPIDWLRNTNEDWNKFCRLLHQHSE